MITVIGNLTADGAAVTPKGIAEGWRLDAAVVAGLGWSLVGSTGRCDSLVDARS
jgi:hypothetical protein